MKQYRRRLRLQSVESGVATFHIYSRSKNTGLGYIVTVANDQAYCTCSAYKFRGDCWHAQRALEYTQKKGTE